MESQKTGCAKIANQDVICGSVTINAPRFDVSDPRNADYVLVQVNAFSCNYRDKALMVRAAEKMEKQEGAQPFAFFGSDFVGTIKAAGRNVSDLRDGMKVIPDCAYPYAPSDSVAPGVVTNEASRRWLRLHRAKLLPIPDSMPDEIAASYSIGSQTSDRLPRHARTRTIRIREQADSTRPQEPQTLCTLDEWNCYSRWPRRSNSRVRPNSHRHDCRTNASVCCQTRGRNWKTTGRR